MNILFLVMSFILIFVFLNATLLKKSSFFSLETHSSQEYFSAQNALLKKFESAKYKDYLKSHQKQEKVLSALKSSIPSSSFVSHRLKSEIPSLGKWNLTALLHAEGLSLLLLQELTEKLLIELYGKASFWREAEKQIPQLAKALTHSFLGKKETAFSLVDLFPVEESLQEPFYKMLKGSGFYQFQPQQGYPPLEDFFCFLEQENKITAIPYAAYPILSILFPEEIVQKILKLEREKWEETLSIQSIKKEELLALCQEKSLTIKGKKLQDLEPFLLFSAQKVKTEKLCYQNKKTQIHVQMRAP